MRLKSLPLLPAIWLASSFAHAVDAQSEQPSKQEKKQNLSNSQACEGNACTLVYERSFFDKYVPITALDIVRNTPGFQIDEGDQSRGFAGAAGNVLINSKRPSSKSETVSDILSRLPADSVAEIQLIRGQSGGLDLRGQSVVVNVILVAGTNATTTFDFQAATRTLEYGEIFGRARINHSRSADDYEITLGAEVERGGFQSNQLEQVLGPQDELLELREERYEEAGWNWKLSLNGKAQLGDYTFALNTAYSERGRDGGEVSARTPAGQPSPFFLLQGSDESQQNFEIGGDIERSFGTNWTVKLVGLYSEEDAQELGSLSRGPSADSVLDETLVDLSSLTTETIGRVEIDYRGIKNHVIELSGEYARNNLFSNFSLSEALVAGGPLLPVSVAGADTEIGEERGDISLSDSWNMGNVVIDTTLAAETSTISQAGDIANQRSFEFFKPSLALSYSPSEKLQLRLRAERLVGQLNFNDFASSTDLGDDELALGNPDLQPDTRWRFSASSEWRFLELGSLTLTGFHEEISDVVDVLLAGPGLEAVGNIGSATRSGIVAEGTLPLGGVGVPGGRLDFNANVQTSNVTDPVSGLDRRLSGQQTWEVVTEFRQDFNKEQISWGGVLVVGDYNPFFGIDEFDRNIRNWDLDMFVEATRFNGLRFRLSVNNVFGNGRDRDRRVFDGFRSSDPLLFREFRERNFGLRVALSVRGTF